MKIVVFGVGGTWKEIKDYLDYDEAEIIAFLDNKKETEYIKNNGRLVNIYSPSDFFNADIKYDVILIASRYYEEIQEQLINDFHVARESITNSFCCDRITRTIFKKTFFYQDVEENLLKAVKTQIHLQAKTLILNMRNLKVHSIRDVEFKVYSQWGEDGIIQWLINRIPIKNKTFIEFGVEDYKEANTRLLLEENNWSGMVIDGSYQNIESIKKDEIYWKHNLNAKCAFITRENINDLLLESGFDEDLGLLSIDLDGNDYWILKTINVVKPRILICEFNAIFGESRAVTVKYKEDYERTKAHYSNLYYGASLKAIITAAEEKEEIGGYTFIGTNSNACNAFFIRNDLVEYLPKEILQDKGVVHYQFRQARDMQGNLLYLDPYEEKQLICDMELWDIQWNKEIKVKDL